MLGSPEPLFKNSVGPRIRTISGLIALLIGAPLVSVSPGYAARLEVSAAPLQTWVVVGLPAASPRSEAMHSDDFSQSEEGGGSREITDHGAAALSAVEGSDPLPESARVTSTSSPASP